MLQFTVIVLYKERAMLLCKLKSYANLVNSTTSSETIASTLPVTRCECERSVSQLRYLKTYLRTIMREERLNGLAMMYVHRNVIGDAMTLLVNFQDD